MNGMPDLHEKKERERERDRTPKITWETQDQEMTYNLHMPNKQDPEMRPNDPNAVERMIESECNLWMHGTSISPCLLWFHQGVLPRPAELSSNSEPVRVVAANRSTSHFPCCFEPHRRLLPCNRMTASVVFFWFQCILSVWDWTGSWMDNGRCYFRQVLAFIFRNWCQATIVFIWSEFDNMISYQ